MEFITEIIHISFSIVTKNVIGLSMLFHLVTKNPQHMKNLLREFTLQWYNTVTQFPLQQPHYLIRSVAKKVQVSQITGNIYISKIFSNIDYFTHPEVTVSARELTQHTVSLEHASPRPLRKIHHPFQSTGKRKSHSTASSTSSGHHQQPSSNTPPDSPTFNRRFR